MKSANIHYGSERKNRRKLASPYPTPKDTFRTALAKWIGGKELKAQTDKELLRLQQVISELIIDRHRSP